MFKFIVLCAFVAAASANPGILNAVTLPLPIGQYPSYLGPVATSISQQDTSIIHPTPALYSGAPVALAHLIKKRSPQLPLTYIAPSTGFIAQTPYVAGTTLQAPLISSASILPAIAPISPAVHLIKKRSAPLLPTTYFTGPTYAAAAAPILTTSYASTAPLIPASPLISQPIAAYTHLIKKRSAPLLTPYVAPASFSSQSRFDLQTTHTPVTSISYSSPITYSSPLAYSHYF